MSYNHLIDDVEIGQQIRIKTTKYKDLWKIVSIQDFRDENDETIWLRLVLNPVVCDADESPEIFLDLLYNDDFMYIMEFNQDYPETDSNYPPDYTIEIKRGKQTIETFESLSDDTDGFQALLIEDEDEGREVEYWLYEGSGSRVMQITLDDEEFQVYTGIKIKSSFIEF